MQGGITRIGHMIRVIKKREPEALVVDAGDIFQGTPLYTKYHGEVEVALLNMIGYDLFTIGNHEFDDGPQNLAQQLKKARFKIVNCNMDASKVPELAELISPYVIKEVEGQKVAFIGAITPDLNQVALHTDGVKLKASGSAWMKPIEETVKTVTAQGINKIVLVTHVGIELDKQLGTLNDVDVIVSGHSHTRLDQPVVIPHPDGSSTTIVQTGSFARALGKLELTFDDQGRVIVPKTEYRLINMTDKIPEDKDLRAYVDEKLKPLLPLRQTIAGVARGAFDNGFRNMPFDSSLGDVICDALVESGKEYGARIAFENRGGIRGRIEPGPISLEEIEELLPFDNKAVLATVDGDCLRKALERSLSGGLGGPFLDEHGLKIAYDPEKEKGARVVFALAQTESGQWQPLDPAKKYKIAINDYSFGGGESYDFKSATNIVRQSDRLSEIFKSYLKSHKEITPGPPDRLIPVVQSLLTVGGDGKEKVLHVRHAPPLARLIFVSGAGRGISLSSDGTPVPLTEPQVIGKARCDKTGACDWSWTANDRSTGYVAVVARPASKRKGPGAAQGGAGSSSAKALTSYPQPIYPGVQGACDSAARFSCASR